MLTEDFEGGLAKLRALTASGQRRSDVRGGGALALPSLARRRRADRARSQRRAHHRLHALDAAPPDAVREGRGRARHAIPARTPRGRSRPAPFHLEATVRVLQRRPTNRVDVWEQERYLRVLEAGTVSRWWR